MEELSLPFPTLQFLASCAIGRCLVLKVNYHCWSELPLPPALRKYVRNVLRGLFEQVQPWIYYHGRKPGTEILLDAHGNFDERRTIRHHLEKRYEDQFFREDFRPLFRFLEHFSAHYPESCSTDFVSIILDLQKVNTAVVGPEYRLVDEKLQVVFRFVNRRSVPPEFNTLLEWKRRPLKISLEQNDVLVTYSAFKHHYDEDMFRIHFDLLHPRQRLWFAERLVRSKMTMGLVQHVFRFLNVLDPETRQNSLLCLSERHLQDEACCFLKCCLIPGYESLFMPMLKLVGQNLSNSDYFDLFASLVDKVDLIGYDSLLWQFWELLPASQKSEFRDALERGYYVFKYTMKRLSRANADLFQVLLDNMSASLPKEWNSVIFA